MTTDAIPLPADPMKRRTTRDPLSARLRLSRPASFTFLAVTLVIFLATASAPSPIYPLYGERWGFPVSMTTVIFAAYVVALLATLLVVGSLSDHVGRRPVLIGAAVLAAASTAVFSLADGVTALIIARIIQGIATGAATGALAAALVDFAPPQRSHLGGTVTGVGTGLGMAFGAAASGLLIPWTSIPDRIIFPVLTALFVLIALVLIAVPDVVSPRPGALRSLRPDVRVPHAARRAFAHTAPSTIAAWASTGLFLAIAPSLLQSAMNVHFAAAGGISIAALFVAVALGGVWGARHVPRGAVTRGALLLSLGALGLTAATWIAQPILFMVAAAFAGFGVGMTFSGNLRMLGAVATPESRSQIFAANYVVSYGALSVASLAAGLVSPVIGLSATGIAYAVTIAVSAGGSALHSHLVHLRARDAA